MAPAVRKLVGLLWRWHRRTGVFLFLFIVFLSVTGIVLNHTSELDLDSRFVDSAWVLSLYGDDSRELPAYPLNDAWLTRAVNGTVYWNTSKVGSCHGELVGAAFRQDLLVVACAEEVLLLTAQGELIESISASTGLPVPLSALGVTGSDMVLMTADGWRVADLDALQFNDTPTAGAAIAQLAPGELPQSLRDKIPHADQWLTWERLLLDLHSGRIAGMGGVLFIDLVGVLLICIASSGLTMWLVHRARRRGRRS